MTLSACTASPIVSRWVVVCPSQSVKGHPNMHRSGRSDAIEVEISAEDGSAAPPTEGAAP